MDQYHLGQSSEIRGAHPSNREPSQKFSKCYAKVFSKLTENVLTVTLVEHYFHILTGPVFHSTLLVLVVEVESHSRNVRKTGQFEHFHTLIVTFVKHSWNEILLPVQVSIQVNHTTRGQLEGFWHDV